MDTLFLVASFLVSSSWFWGGAIVESVRHRHCDGPADSQPWGFQRLALQAAKKTPPGAHIHANPPIKTLQHAQPARGAKVTRSRPYLNSTHCISTHAGGRDTPLPSRNRNDKVCALNESHPTVEGCSSQQEFSNLS